MNFIIACLSMSCMISAMLPAEKSNLGFRNQRLPKSTFNTVKSKSRLRPTYANDPNSVEGVESLIKQELVDAHMKKKFDDRMSLNVKNSPKTPEYRMMIKEAYSDASYLNSLKAPISQESIKKFEARQKWLISNNRNEQAIAELREFNRETFFSKHHTEFMNMMRNPLNQDSFQKLESYTAMMVKSGVFTTEEAIKVTAAFHSQAVKKAIKNPFHENSVITISRWISFEKVHPIGQETDNYVQSILNSFDKSKESMLQRGLVNAFPVNIKVNGHGYTLKSRLGKGRFGTSYEAISDLDKSSKLVIKYNYNFHEQIRGFYPPDIFHNEISALNILGNLVDYDESNLIIVQKKIDGETLASLLRHENNPQIINHLVEKYHQLARQFYYFTSEILTEKNQPSESQKSMNEDIKKAGYTIPSYDVSGLIHGDISPENVMVLPNGELELIDFGFTTKAASINDPHVIEMMLTKEEENANVEYLLYRAYPAAIEALKNKNLPNSRSAIQTYISLLKRANKTNLVLAWELKYQELFGKVFLPLVDNESSMREGDIELDPSEWGTSIRDPADYYEWKKKMDEMNEKSSGMDLQSVEESKNEKDMKEEKKIKKIDKEVAKGQWEVPHLSSEMDSLDQTIGIIREIKKDKKLE